VIKVINVFVLNLLMLTGHALMLVVLGRRWSHNCWSASEDI